MEDRGKAFASRQLRTIFGPGSHLGASDEELLERFVGGERESSEAAFEAIVLRHGGMVQRVCRGILRDFHTADDAFQATFLVLARRARGLAVRGTLGPWLHGVARRVAEHARSDIMRRSRHERLAAERMRIQGKDEADTTETLALALHATIDSLPERYRAAVVLCDLQGLTHDQAAAVLDCPPGTIKSRLSRGREKLRERLMRRGYGDSTPILAAQTPVDALVRAAVQVARSPKTVSMPVRVLSMEVLRAMVFVKLKIGLAVALVMGLTVGGAMAFWGPPRGRTPASSPEEPPAQAADANPRNGSITFRKVEVDADDIREVANLDIFKFELDSPKDRRFSLVLRERKESAPWHELYRYSFVKKNMERTTFRVSFLRRDRRFEGALLSDAPDAEFRVNSPGCAPTGIVTIVQIPLREQPAVRRMLRTHVSNAENDQRVEGEAPEPGIRRLITIQETSNDPSAPPRPPEAPTRAELILIEED